MPSERIQRQIDRLLDEAEASLVARDWPIVARAAGDALSLDPENEDARTLLTAAEQNLDGVGPLRAASGAVAPLTPALSIPESFAAGRYEVKRFLGEGGKKKVYLAHDSLLDRDVAFALIKTEGLDAASRARITREAQAMGRLGSHPHIVTVFDLGEEGEQPYMVTELMGGGDVEGLIEKADEHRVPLEDALRIASEVCAGLEFAHARGIVHRDLKPGNVWLTADGIAKIGDFGLAVAVDRSRLTQIGMMVGTVSYMPPEQATGGEVTARSDLYSLGAMLYELVCGRPPFVGDENVAIIGQHLNTPPVAPSWHRGDVPPGLETLILRLLAKDPSQRPASATEVREALGRIDLSSVPANAESAAARADDPAYRQTFVGREPELKTLQTTFDAAISGQGGLVMVVGEPGIGKTALCEQLATYAAIRGGRVLRGSCYEEGSLSLPYLAFVEAMRSYVLSREPEDLQAELGTSAAYVARIVTEVRDRVPVEAVTPGDPEDDRWRLLQAVTTFLRNAADVQPLLLVLEDLHWSDRGTLDLLLHLARNLQGTRLLVIGSYRDVEVDRAHPLSSALAELRRIQNFAAVRLRGLSVDEVQRMMSNIRGQDVARSRAELVYRQTEGHPLFVQEVLRYLVEEGITVRQDGRYVLADADAAIPEGLRDVIGKRISRLSDECNRVLSVAAVIGRDFAFETLVDVSALPEESVLAALEEALRVGVLQEQASAANDVRYRFAHAFFRQTLYEELIAPRRLRLHQQVARSLEARHARRLDEHAAELAEHFSYSTDPADLAKAVQYAERAAHRASVVFDYGEASRLLDKALGVHEVFAPDDTDTRLRLLLALGTALMPAGEPDRVAAHVAPLAFAAAEGRGDKNLAAEASLLALAALAQARSAMAWGTTEYREWAARADRTALPGTAARAWADVALSNVAIGSGDYIEVWRLIKRALDVARTTGDAGAYYAAAAGALNLLPTEALDECLALAREAFAGPLERADARFFTMSVPVILAGGDRPLSDMLWARLREVATRTRDPRMLIGSLAGDVYDATLAGDLLRADEITETMPARGDEVGTAGWGRQAAVLFGSAAALWLGRCEAALSRLDSAATFGEETPIGSARRAFVLALLGRSDEASKLLEAFQPMLTNPNPVVPLQLCVWALETALVVGDASVARQFADALAPAAMLAGPGRPGPTPARLLGAEARLRGSPAEARPYFEQALQIAKGIGFRPEIALIRLELAELLSESYPAEAVSASDHLAFATEEFREMKMQPSLERALRHRGLLKA